MCVRSLPANSQLARWHYTTQSSCCEPPRKTGTRQELIMKIASKVTELIGRSATPKNAAPVGAAFDFGEGQNQHLPVND